MSSSDLDFIRLHRDADVRQLALRHMPEGVDGPWCLQQIEGRQLAVGKLPKWAANDDLWFPSRLSIEQCSSEATALYKRQIIERLLPNSADRRSMVDFTGGMGVDFSFIAPLFLDAVYVEKQKSLCDIARHNLPLLGLPNAKIVNAECSKVQGSKVLVPASCRSMVNGQWSMTYLDPARRDNAGRKMVALEDCTPDVVDMQDWLLENAHIVMVKLSPMLDISMLLRKLTHVKEIHVVSVRGECKELLVVLSKDIERRKLFCVNLESDDPAITRSLDEKATRLPELADEMGAFLYEPNASVLKAGVQDSVGQQLGLRKLHPNSNLFTGDEWTTDFPGRSFVVEGTSGFGKRELRNFLQGITQANITVRNFPASTAELRKKLDLKEGGETYLFATTMKDGQHRLVRCRKAI